MNFYVVSRCFRASLRFPYATHVLAYAMQDFAYARPFYDTTLAWHVTGGFESCSGGNHVFEMSKIDVLFLSYGWFFPLAGFCRAGNIPSMTSLTWPGGCLLALIGRQRAGLDFHEGWVLGWFGVDLGEAKG